MSRYIDADVLKYYGNHIGDEYEDRFHDAQWVYRSQIDEAPSIDIVRCKNCRYCKMKKITFKGEPYIYYECKELDRVVEDDEFCSWGDEI